MINSVEIQSVHKFTTPVPKWTAQYPRVTHYLAYQLTGCCTHYFKNKVLVAAPKTLLFVNNNDSYNVVVNEYGNSLVVAFTADNMPDSCIFDCKDYGQILNIMNTLMKHKQLKIETNYYECMSLLYKLIVFVITHIEKDYVNSSSVGKIHIVRRYILEHYGDHELNCDELCEICGFSPKYLRVIFKNEYGMTPYQYLLNVRINEAKKLLCSSESTVSQIAENVGFGKEAYYFSKVFRKYTGMSPNDYRSKRHTDIFSLL